jgi:hypothetical protein
MEDIGEQIYILNICTCETNSNKHGGRGFGWRLKGGNVCVRQQNLYYIILTFIC